MYATVWLSHLCKSASRFNDAVQTIFDVFWIRQLSRLFREKGFCCFFLQFWQFPYSYSRLSHQTSGHMRNYLTDTPLQLPCLSGSKSSIWDRSAPGTLAQCSKFASRKFFVSTLDTLHPCAMFADPLKVHPWWICTLFVHNWRKR